MKRNLTSSRSPFPALVPGMAGMPKLRGKDPLFTPSQGSLGAMRSAFALRGLAAGMDSLGFVCTPDISVVDAIGAVSGTTGPGGRIFFAEGTWDFHELGQVVAARSRLEFISLSPGKTTFRRTSTSALSGTGKYLVSVTASYCRFDGLRFYEPGNSYYAVMSLAGGYADVINCQFATVYGAVEVTSSYNSVCENLVTGNTAADALLITSGAGNVVANNRVV